MLLTQVKDDREVVTLCPQLLHFPFKNWWSHQHLFGISYLPIVHLPFIITCTSSSNPMWWALWLFPFDRWGRLCLDRFSDEFWRRQWHPHSNTLAWKIPWTEEPGGPQSMGSWRVRHDWATSLSLFTFMHWRRKWQPTPVFLPGGSQRWQSLVGCRLWGRTESDSTEVIWQQQQWWVQD